MSKLMKKRPQPALVVAIVALVLAATGGAVAGTTSHRQSKATDGEMATAAKARATDRQIKAAVKRYIRSHRKSLRGPRGAQGPAGPAGPAGPGGTQGPAGPGNTTWQLAVNGNGTTQFKHDGISVKHNRAGNYTITWTGFPGKAFAYCQGIGRRGLVTGLWSYPGGTGTLTIDFEGSDTTFTCAIIGLTK